MKWLLCLILLSVPVAATAQVNVDYDRDHFEWSAGVGGGAPTEYRIKCGTAPGARTLVKVVPLPYAPVPVNTVLPTSGTYYCVVVAANQYGESGESNEIGPLVLGVAPSAPSNFRKVTR